MMIPVRVAIDAPIHTVGGVRTLAADHWALMLDCPACGDQLRADDKITLVLVGISPADRAEGKRWTTGGAVVVHAECAGLSDTSRGEVSG